MARVSWSDGAEDDLVNAVRDPDLIDQLRHNAEVTLHDTQGTLPDDPDEGAADGIMWHRGFTHDQQRCIREGTLPEPESEGPQVWDFFFFYRPQPWSWRHDFEVLHVRTKYEVAGRIPP